MAHDVPQQPNGSPHDALQRLLDPVLNHYVVAALAVVWLLTVLGISVLVFGSLLLVHPITSANLTPTVYLFHLWVAVNALIFLQAALTGVVFERAPMRLSPAVRQALARQATRRPGAGWRAAWTGIWAGSYFA